MAQLDDWGINISKDEAAQKAVSYLVEKDYRQEEIIALYQFQVQSRNEQHGVPEEETHLIDPPSKKKARKKDAEAEKAEA
jgi:hypothetical protein